MEWSNVVLWSVFIICTTTIIGFIIKCYEKFKLSKISFEQSEKLEDKKQVNALALIEARKESEPKESLALTADKLEKMVKDLNEKIKTADDTTKQNLEKAKAQIEIYEKFLNKKA